MKEASILSKFAIDTVIIFVAIVIALPASLSIFDDEIRIKVDDIEEDFQQYKQ